MATALTGGTDMDMVTTHPTYPTVDEDSLRRHTKVRRGSASSSSSSRRGSKSSTSGDITKKHAGREQDSSDYDQSTGEDDALMIKENRGSSRKAAKRSKQSSALERTANLKPAADDDQSTEEEEALKNHRDLSRKLKVTERSKQSSVLVRNLKTDRVCVAAGLDDQGETCKCVGREGEK